MADACLGLDVQSPFGYLSWGACGLIWVGTKATPQGCPLSGDLRGAKEDKSGWSTLPRHLVDRGLKGVQLVISDACRGALSRASRVPAGGALPTLMLKAIHAQESREGADNKAQVIIGDLGKQAGQGSRPRRTHWQKIRINEPTIRWSGS
jgi:hypothetical protein